MMGKSQWEKMPARTEDNLAASRELLKDADAVACWSRTAPGGGAGRQVVVARLQHDLDLAHSPQLLAWLRSFAAPDPAAGTQEVVVDLRDVTLIDGSGLSCLVTGHRAPPGGTAGSGQSAGAGLSRGEPGEDHSCAGQPGRVVGKPECHAAHPGGIPARGSREPLPVVPLQEILCQLTS